MTSKEREAAKDRKTREIEYAGNVAVLLDAAMRQNFTKAKEISVLSRMSRQGWGAFEENERYTKASLSVLFSKNLNLSVLNWQVSDGIERIGDFFRILKENEDLIVSDGAAGKILIEVERKLSFLGVRHIFSFQFQKEFPDFMKNPSWQFPPPTDNPLETLGIEMEWLTGGEFALAGGIISPRLVKVPDFSISRETVSRRQFLEVMGDERPAPLEDVLSLGNPCTVSWSEAVIFCNRLSEICGKAPCYSVGGKSGAAELVERAATLGATKFPALVEFNGGNGFRLPTEAEFEYASRKNALNFREKTIAVEFNRLQESGEWLRESGEFGPRLKKFPRKITHPNGLSCHESTHAVPSLREGGFRVAASDCGG